MNKSGFLYFLINPSMPGLVKIGHTTGTVEARVKKLSVTGVPQSFVVAATFLVKDSERCEKSVHKVLNKYRLEKNREFFQAPIQKLLEIAIPIIGEFISSTIQKILSSEDAQELDGDDIYFMKFLLHDGYENGESIRTDQLVKHHDKYAPLELEYKLLKLVDVGVIERIKSSNGGLSSWIITPKGIRFMFENNHILHDLIAESRPSAWTNPQKN